MLDHSSSGRFGLYSAISGGGRDVLEPSNPILDHLPQVNEDLELEMVQQQRGRYYEACWTIAAVEGLGFALRAVVVVETSIQRRPRVEGGAVAARTVPRVTACWTAVEGLGSASRAVVLVVRDVLELSNTTLDHLPKEGGPSCGQPSRYATGIWIYWLELLISQI